MVLEKHSNGQSDTAVDVEYYENTLKKLVVAKARAVSNDATVALGSFLLSTVRHLVFDMIILQSCLCFGSC